jgi:hypothetical protein
MGWPRLAADLIVVIHATYVGFVVLGMLAIVLGAIFRWSWVRNIWFRAIHLVAIGIVAGESALGIACPLTVWEARLRKMAGQGGYTGDFLGYWAHRLIFVRAEPWVFTVLYILFGLLVLVAFVLVPPRWPGSSETTAEPATTKENGS